jgi:hypothetical protein
MTNSSISDWTHTYRGMMAKPLRQVSFATKEGIRLQSIAIEEIRNDGKVALSCEIVCY